MDTKRLTLKVTQHALSQIAAKGFDPLKVRATFDAPDRVTDVRAHPGQVRLIGNGLALVGRVERSTFVLVTVYVDGVLTPPRADQMTTTEGRRYAARYAAGLGRG